MYSLEYLAGIFDGEGSSSIAQRTRSGFKVFTPYLSCCNTYKPVIDALKERFGGSVHESKGTNYPVYNWIVSNKLAYKAAKVLVKHTHIKRKQLEILIEWRDKTLNMTKCGRWKDVHAIRHELYTQITEDYMVQFKGSKYARFVGEA